MTQSFTIPGGQEKGAPLAEASDKSLEYWADRIGASLEKGESRYPDRDRALWSAISDELHHRKGGAAPATSTPRTAPQQQRQAPAANNAPAASTAIAARKSDKLSGSFSDAHAANEALREAVSQYNLVAPATHCGMLPEGCGVALSLVYVDITKVGDKYPAGEVVEVGGKLMLTGTTLKKIAAAASVDWDTAESGRLDDGRDPHYCHYRAVGWIKNFDGSRRRVSGEVEVDARDGSPQEQEIRTKAEARRKKNPSWTNDGGDSQLLELRKFLLRHAETKAKLRAIADMGVARAYTAEQLRKPFAVAKLVWTGQTKDPELRRFFAEKQMENMMGGARALYGAQPAPAAALPSRHHGPPPVGAVPHEDDGDSYVDMAPEPLPPQQPAEALPPEQDRGDDPDAY